MKEQKIFGVFVGRFCPIHLGHEVVISQMVKTCGKNCLIVLGSSSASLSLRNFFSYSERRAFLLQLFPGLRVVGLPDYPTDEEWMLALDDLLRLWGIDPQEVVFFGGCEEDVIFFVEHKRKCHLLNRFDGSTPKVSATEVRDALIQSRSLKKLLNPLIAKQVKDTFAMKWDKFRKM